MSVQAYINFNGNYREAVDYYAKIFKTELQQIMTFGDYHKDPSFPLPDEAKGMVMHTFLIIKGSMVMFSDVPPGMDYVRGNNISLTIVSNDVEDIKDMYSKLKEEGTVGVELQDTGWSKCYAFVTDKFGIGWQLNYGE